MTLKTNQSIIKNRGEITLKIASFWDRLSEGWQIVWGNHIHHGYYDDQVSTPNEAQEKLIKKLTDKLHINPQDTILDVGCGMGGSSIYLAKHYQAIVTGITLSRKQISMATQQAQIENVKNVTFKIEDALSLSSFKDNSFDIVWSLESCEQFFDKNLFLQQAYRVLKPGGQLLLATWCSDQDEYDGQLAKDYQKLCLAFDLPYMPTINHYLTLLNAQDFAINFVDDWTSSVKKSWDIGVSLLNTYSFLRILKVGGLRGIKFVRQLRLMQKAFHQNRVKYAVFLVSKRAKSALSC